MALSVQTAVGFLFLTLSAAAAAPSIGTVSAAGDFRLDSYVVQSNATVFEGALLETAQVPADLKLNQRINIRMAMGSRGKVFADHLVLLEGESDVSSHSLYRVEAEGLMVTSESSESHGRVAIQPDRTVLVSAISGGLAVKDGNGTVIADLHPGNALAFAQFENAPPRTLTMSGLLISDGGKLYLQETDTIRYELRGSIPSKLIGKKIVIRGVFERGEPGGVSAIRVSELEEASKAGEMPAATKWMIVGAAAVGAAIPVIYYSARSSHPASL